MKLPIKDITGKQQGELEVKFDLVDSKKGNHAVHETVVAFRAAQRSGTASAKTVGEVAGSNKKPWRQKGTGRARAGSFRSPLWRGGGVVFGPKPRDFTKKVNKKARQLALRKALTERLKTGDVIVVDDLNIAAPKTKAMMAVLKALQLEGTTLIVQAATHKNLLLSARNIPDVQLTTGDKLNTYDVLRADKLLFTQSAFEQVETRLKKDNE